MSDRPLPLTPADCNLQDFEHMQLYVRRLRDSRFASHSSGDGFRAGLLLWASSWHQVPAASVPDDDVELAQLTGYGRVAGEFIKVRTEALYGFVLCSDGRWYHPIVARNALAAWEQKLAYGYKKFADRLRKEFKSKGLSAENAPPIPTLEQWKHLHFPATALFESSGIPSDAQKFPAEKSEIPAEKQKAEAEKCGTTPEGSGQLPGFDDSGGDSSDGIPSENALKGRGRGRTINSVPNGTDGAAVTKSPADLAKAELWRAAVSLLDRQGMPEPQARSFIGKLAKDYPDGETLLEAVRIAVSEQPADARAYLKSTCQRLAGERRPTNAKLNPHVGTDQRNYEEDFDGKTIT